MSKIIGIDLGTTNSCVAIVENGHPIVIPNSEGNRTTPSIVAFSKDDERLIGNVAKRQAITNPNKTIASIKRHMGTDYEVSIDDKKYTPQEISAMILQKLKIDAEAYLGEKVEKAVITVPAYFNDSQRQATKDAGKIAGLEVERIINEPTASALAYGLDKDKESTVLVYDLGGGTFDVSVLTLADGIFEVKATAGNNHLGGDDFDERLVDYLIDKFRSIEGVDLSNDKIALQRLRDAAEKAKIELSTLQKTNINLPYITATADSPKHLDIDVTRATFEQLISDLLDRTIEPVKQALNDANVEKINHVLLVGGSTRIPKVVELVKNITGIEPDKNINPDECVALGAAIQGSVLSGETTDIVLLDVTPLSLSIETLGGLATKLIERNTTIPTKKSQIFSTAEDNQTSVTIHVTQGEREFSKDNFSLGKFDLTGIPPARKGVPQIEVTFDIDSNGIVHVSAKDMSNGHEQSMTITGRTDLSDKDIEQMIKDAKEYEEADKKRKDEVIARNNAENVIYEANKVLNEYSDKIEDKSKIENAIKLLQEILEKEGATIEDINMNTQMLQSEIFAVTEKIYKENKEKQEENKNEENVNNDGETNTDQDISNSNTTDNQEQDIIIDTDNQANDTSDEVKTN